MNNDSKTIHDWCLEINRFAHFKGFWESGHPREIIVEKILLAITELSEAFECLRTNPDPKLAWLEGGVMTGKPEGFPVEIADCVIRMFDLCGELDLDLEMYIRQKHNYNLTRPYKHGRHPSST